MIDPAHGDRHRRWPESQEGATPALPGPPRCSACSSLGPGASCRLPGHPPAAPSPYAPQSTRHERWVAHFTEVWAGAGRGTLQSSRANRRSRDPRPSDKSLSHFHQQEVDTSLQRPALLSSSLTPDPQAPPGLVRGGWKGGQGQLLVEPLHLLRSQDPGVTVAWVSHTRTKEAGQ